MDAVRGLLVTTVLSHALAGTEHGARIVGPTTWSAVPTHKTAQADAEAQANFDDLLPSGGGLHCVYQPFVDLDTGPVMAFEALLRGPAATAAGSRRWRFWEPHASLNGSPTSSEPRAAGIAGKRGTSVGRKLDLMVLRTIKDTATAIVAGAVRAYAELAGAEVVAEGIETPHDLTRA